LPIATPHAVLQAASRAALASPAAARDALCLATARLDAAERAGQAYEMSQALAAMGRACEALGGPGWAEAYLQAALRWAHAAQAGDGVVDLLCELAESAARSAELLRAQQPEASRAARERARDHVFAASILAGRVADRAWEATVLLRISDVLDRCGDREDAVLLQTRALRLMAGGSTAHPVSDAAAWLPGPGRLADS
jgi:hypothetical protein